MHAPRGLARTLVAVLSILAASVVASRGSSAIASMQPPTTPEATQTRLTQSPPADDLVWLRDRMVQAIEEYWVPGRYAVAVTDLQTGETVSVNGDRPQLSGCVVNLFALLHATRDVWAMRYPLEDVESLIAATIWSSNAITARDLYRVVGGGDVLLGVQRVEQFVREDLHLPGVILDHPPAFDDSIGISPDNWVTAESMNAALGALWRNEAIPEPSWRDFLLYHMTQVKPGLNYLTAVTPEVVSHKNGFMWASNGYVDNDVGIVRLVGRDGGEYAYAISFLSEGVETEYADIPLGQQLTYLAYEAMSARYQQ